MIRYADLFLDQNTMKEVRTQWSSLFQSFHRNKFSTILHMEENGGTSSDLEDAMERYTKMFHDMENWCDDNCSGMWTAADNHGALDEEADELDLEIDFMFEHESDLLRFISESALLAKLTYQ